MTHFMGEREHVLQRVGVIHQHEGMRTVGPGGVGARGLALVLVHVDPSAVEAVVQITHVFRAERAQRFFHHAHGVGPGHMQ